MDHARAGIDTVVFDLGGVLIDWNPRYLYRKLIPDERVMERFLKEICHGEWNETLDRGRPFAEGVAELVALHPAEAPLIQAYFHRWPEMLGGALDETVAVLRELHASRRYRLLALSNWSAETFPVAERRFDFFGLLTERHGISPSRSVFIDDAERNIAAARELGFQVIHFTDQNSLRSELSSLGVALK
jgi:2-haloacid dehalogenase